MTRRRAHSLAVWCALTLWCGTAAAQEPIVINQSTVPTTLVEVTVGHSSVLQFVNPVERASVNDDKVADVIVVSPTELLVHGKHPGTTSLIIWQAGSNQLISLTVERDVALLRKTLRGVLPEESIEVRSASGVIILSGLVSSREVSDQALSIAGTYADEVVNLLRVRRRPLEEVLSEVLPEESMTVHAWDDEVILMGEVSSETAKEYAVTVAESYGAKVTDFLSVQAKQVLIEVRFAEVDRSLSRSLGLDYILQDNRFTQTGFIGGALSPQLPSTPQFTRIGPTDLLPSSLVNQLLEWRSTELDISLALNALEEEGLLRILAEPNLLAMSGERASFLAGGEFPIPVVQSSATAGVANNAVTIEFKEFGIRLNFEPTVIDDDTIRIFVEPEVSVLDFGPASVKLGGFEIPGLITRRASTTVQMRSGESLVIGGLLSQVDTRTNSRIPWLSNVPVIGQLFKSERFKKEETELLVLVTPRLTDPSSADGPARFSDMKQVHDAFSAQLGAPPFPEPHAEALRRAYGAPEPPEEAGPAAGDDPATGVMPTQAPAEPDGPGPTQQTERVEEEPVLPPELSFERDAGTANDQPVTSGYVEKWVEMPAEPGADASTWAPVATEEPSLGETSTAHQGVVLSDPPENDGGELKGDGEDDAQLMPSPVRNWQHAIDAGSSDDGAATDDAAGLTPPKNFIRTGL